MSLVATTNRLLHSPFPHPSNRSNQTMPHVLREIIIMHSTEGSSVQIGSMLTPGHNLPHIVSQVAARMEKGENQALRAMLNCSPSAADAGLGGHHNLSSLVRDPNPNPNPPTGLRKRILIKGSEHIIPRPVLSRSGLRLAMLCCSQLCSAHKRFQDPFYSHRGVLGSCARFAPSCFAKNAICNSLHTIS